MTTTGPIPGIAPGAGAHGPIRGWASRAFAYPGVTIGVVALATAAWAFTAWTSLDMASAYAQLAMPTAADWSLANALAVFAMWSTMMAAMMLPSALPVLLLFAGMARKGGANGSTRLWMFVAGYLAVWCGLSAVAAGLHWLLLAAGMLEPMQVASAEPMLTTGLLLLAGVVQFSPLKQVCLTHCRSPLGFMVKEWRDGATGAWAMGMRHGLFCIGCCWALTLLLFAFGAMNLGWVVLVAAIVAIEKLAPRGVLLARSLGMAMMAAAAIQLVVSILE